MKRIQEEKLIAELFLNIKNRRKKSNPLRIAEICKILSEKYGSPKKLAEKLDVSYETIRSFLKLLELPEPVQQLIKNGKIGFDVGQRIARIPSPKKQIEVAKSVIGLNAHDAREVIQYIIRQPNASPQSVKKRLLRHKKKNYTILLLPLEEELYEKLKEKSKSKNISVESLILELIKGRLRK